MSQAMDMFLGRQNDDEVFGTGVVMNTTHTTATKSCDYRICDDSPCGNMEMDKINARARFSGTQEVHGKHVDTLRAIDTPYYGFVIGQRREIIKDEKEDAFDKFAAAEAEKKRIGNINLMCDILRSI